MPGRNEITEKVHVWDLPTRLFHWLLVVFFIVSIVSVKMGNMVIHERSGIAILILISFRILWGFLGGRHARFTSFICGPATALRYLQGMLSGKGETYLGHNPLGAYSVVALLLAVGTQAVTGLFADDEIATQGPLANRVSGATTTLMTRIHHYNEYVMYTLAGLHIVAVLFYLLVKKENLIGPMITGSKAWAGASGAMRDSRGSTALALVVLAIVIGIVWGFILRK